MGKDKKRMTERILNLTLEIIYLLTGEDYTSMKTSSACVTPSSCSCVSGGWGRNQSPILKPPLDSLIHERSNDEKILELASKIIELLTGEVPIRCQDITVYFSTEEWDYLEGHKNLYEDIMIENHHPMTSLDGSCKRSPPESCHSSSLFSQGCPEEAHSDSQDDQGEDQTYIKVEVREAEETYVMGGQQYKEEKNPVDIITDCFRNKDTVAMLENRFLIEDDCTKDSERYLLLSPHYETEENCTSQDISEEHHNSHQITRVSHSKVLSIDPENSPRGEDVFMCHMWEMFYPEIGSY
ncbi:gastrula zinc finger protein XlCGF66.1-like [Bufo bufo]|uniref:gastrula zinc finger protein XlCGF66.1-like n=1 Tax=Bufo bufo TaxID=8384 RepID=UPI001ABDC005|nr:gastrula zinc finger protein XlCGF66.1-like [Bufo bufo]